MSNLNASDDELVQKACLVVMTTVYGNSPENILELPASKYPMSTVRSFIKACDWNSLIVNRNGEFQYLIRTAARKGQGSDEVQQALELLKKHFPHQLN